MSCQFTSENESILLLAHLNFYEKYYTKEFETLYLVYFLLFNVSDITSCFFLICIGFMF